jgi:hypothetical protein
VIAGSKLGSWCKIYFHYFMIFLSNSWVSFQGRGDSNPSWAPSLSFQGSLKYFKNREFTVVITWSCKGSHVVVMGQFILRFLKCLGKYYIFTYWRHL